MAGVLFHERAGRKTGIFHRFVHATLVFSLCWTPCGDPGLCHAYSCPGCCVCALVCEIDCAVCTKGYAQGAGRTCYSCEGANSRAFVSAGAIFFLIMLTLMVVAVVVLVGGLDTLEAVRRSMTRSLSISSKRPVSSRHPVCETSEARKRPSAHASSTVSGGEGGDDVGEPRVSTGGTTKTLGRPASHILPSPAVSDLATSDADKSKHVACCGLGERLKRCASRVPPNKLKILVVVWQILTVFPSITLVDYPVSYSRFLDLIDFVNLDIGQILAAACFVPTLDFYERLLVSTLTPVGLAMALVLTYQLAKRREGSARLFAWSRHTAAGLLVTFLVSFVRVAACGDSFRMCLHWTNGDVQGKFSAIAVRRRLRPSAACMKFIKT